MSILPIRILSTSLAVIPMAAPLAAHPLAPPTGSPQSTTAAAAAENGAAACEDGTTLDDGTAETGYGWVPSVVEGEYVQRFESSTIATTRLESVCVCWLRTGTDSTVDFEILLYRDVGGEPADSPYAVVASSAEVTTIGVVETFFEIGVDGVDLAPGATYVGVRWDPSADSFFFVCADSSDGTEPVPVFFRDDRAAGEWASALDTSDPVFTNHRAMMVRLRSRLVTVLDVPALGIRGLAMLATLLMAAAVGLLRRITSSSRDRSCYNAVATRARD